jgi:glycosyltransferase involved in cell wall biosynthesis
MPKSTSQKKQWPSLSIAMAIFNSARTLEESLQSVADQDYPGQVEIVIADGGSTDDSVAIAKKFGAKIVTVPKDKQNAEYNKGVAVNQAKNEILVMIDHDNILPDKHWLRRMVEPLIDDPEIFGVGVWRFHYDQSMTLLDRYFALIGGPDPVPNFFNKNGHQSWLSDKFTLRGDLIKTKPNYFVVQLDPEMLPALGGNGSILRTKLLKEAQADPDHFFHIDIHVDLARKGYTKYAFVKETVKHLTNNDLIPFLKRRRYFIEKYHFEDQSRRRYSVYEPTKDKGRLLRYIIYAATFVGPLYHSIRGYLRIQDPAWFLHPIMCFAMLIVYGVPTLKEEFKNLELTTKPIDK